MATVKSPATPAAPTSVAAAKKALATKAKVVPIAKEPKAPKEEKVPVVKEPKAVKEPKVKVEKVKVVKEPGISDLLRKIMVPKEGTICAVSFGEANAAVKEAFPLRKQLYSSEFERNFNVLVKEEKLTALKPAEFKIPKVKEEKKAPKVKEEKAPKAVTVPVKIVAESKPTAKKAK